MAHLEPSAKTLEPARAAIIAAAPGAASPVFLRTVLEELRQFGIRERLDERIAWYLEAGDLAGLFERVLTRWEQDFDRDRPGLVGAAMSLLGAARRGLAEPELRDILGDADGPLPHAAWAPLYLAAGELLATRGGLVAIAQPELRRAVERRYVADEGHARAAHLRLADYFETRAGSERRDEELPWQLGPGGGVEPACPPAGRSGNARRPLAPRRVRDAGLLGRVEAASELRMVTVYRPVLDAPDDCGDDTWQVAALLRAAGHVVEALALYEHLAGPGRTRNAFDVASGAGQRRLVPCCAR